MNNKKIPHFLTSILILMDYQILVYTQAMKKLKFGKLTIIQVNSKVRNKNHTS